MLKTPRFRMPQDTYPISYFESALKGTQANKTTMYNHIQYCILRCLIRSLVPRADNVLPQGWQDEAPLPGRDYPLFPAGIVFYLETARKNQNIHSSLCYIINPLLKEACSINRAEYY